MQAPDIESLVRHGAVFYVAHSGGKDSQCMYARVRRRIPHERIVVVHADLGKVEWRGVQDHIRATISHQLHVVRAGKTFFDLVRHRANTYPDVPAFPGAGRRQCTSDLKRDPILKFIRHDMKARGATLPVNCLGLRAEESESRRRRAVWSVSRKLTNSRRTVYEWLPIHQLTRKQVFDEIRRAGQRPFRAYALGNKRLSCVFCIFGCPGDIANGRRERPELYEEYRQLERETGWTLFPRQSLAERAAEGETLQLRQRGDHATQTREDNGRKRRRRP